MQYTVSDFKESKERQKQIKESEVFSGYFSHLELSEQDKKIFLKSLRSKYRTYMFDFLASFLSTSDFLKFLDLFAGDTLNLPDREDLYTVLCDSQIHGFIERKNPKSVEEDKVSDSLIQSASMAFARTKNQVQKSNDRMRKLLSSLKSANLLDLNSLKSRKRTVYVTAEESAKRERLKDIKMLDTDFDSELPPVSTDEADDDPFSDLVPTPKTAEIAPVAPKRRTLESSISSVVKRELGNESSGAMSFEDQTKFAKWLTSQESEPPEAMRVLLSNFDSKLGNSLTYQVADAIIRAQKQAIFLSTIEDKIFDPANIDSLSHNSEELLALHERSMRSFSMQMKFVSDLLKNHPQIFDMARNTDPNPDVADTLKVIRGLSPKKLSKLRDVLDSIESSDSDA